MMPSKLGDCCMPSKKNCRSVPDKNMDETKKPKSTGAREDDVDALVQTILKDPSINISVIPDSVERLIYKSTIQLTLNSFYNVFKGLDGLELFAHKLHLQIFRGDDDDDDEYDGYDVRQRQLPFSAVDKTTATDIDDAVLEQVAARLLANNAINQRFLPDQVEHLLYTNCLKVVFRVLNILTTSLRVTICGHDVGLFLEPTTWQELAQQHSSARDKPDTSSSKQSLLLSEIDKDQLREFARQEAGITEELDSFWDSLFVPKEFVAQLHASLYALILGIIDDMLANTKIEILSDHIKLDIVPLESPKEEEKETEIKVPLSINSQSGEVEETQTEQTSLLTPMSCNGDDVDTPPEIQRHRSTANPQQQQKGICQKLESMGFESERKVFLQRLKEMSPEQRAILAKDLNNMM